MSMKVNILPLVITSRGMDYSELNLTIFWRHLNTKNIKSILSDQVTSTFTEGLYTGNETNLQVLQKPLLAEFCPLAGDEHQTLDEAGLVQLR